MFTYLLTGIVLGLSAGVSPGPLLTLVLSQSVRHGSQEGIKVALVPLLTDLPIVLITVFVLTQLANSQGILGIIALGGGSFVLYLAFESFRTGRLNPNSETSAPQSIGKGMLVNALSPHPYLFWATVGGPMILQAWSENPWQVAVFVAGFYLCLVGSKIVIALLAGQSRQFLAGKNYVYLMRVLGVLLLIFALGLFYEGWQLLGLGPR